METNTKIKKTVIITGYRCNNFCKFCINANKRSLPDSSTEKILSEISQAYFRGSTYLEIIGGEQTMRPDILDIITYARDIGYSQVVMATNGRMFYYGDFARACIEAGLTEIVFSIHGHNAKLHDALTRVPGSFNELLRGLVNVKKIGKCRVASNTTIVKDNFKSLAEVGRLIYKLGIRNAEFIFVDPTQGGAYNDFDSLVPKISVAALYIKKCLDIGVNKTDHWHIRYVPLCYFKEYENQVSEIFERHYFHSEHLAPDFKNFDAIGSRAQIGRIRPRKCKQCKKYDICEGIWSEYYKHYGDRELKPIK